MISNRKTIHSANICHVMGQLITVDILKDPHMVGFNAPFNVH